MPQTYNVAIIGLGVMGRGMAKNILAAGIPLTGYDIFEPARDALAATPGQLPVLARAGVVDAGGAGFLLLLLLTGFSGLLLTALRGTDLLGILLVSVFADVSFGGLGLADGMTIGSQFGVQLIGTVATVVWSAILTVIIVKVVTLVTPLRATPEAETEGLDLFEHGEREQNL